jgi:hypothetical protein
MPFVPEAVKPLPAASVVKTRVPVVSSTTTRPKFSTELFLTLRLQTCCLVGLIAAGNPVIEAAVVLLVPVNEGK